MEFLVTFRSLVKYFDLWFGKLEKVENFILRPLTSAMPNKALVDFVYGSRKRQGPAAPPWPATHSGLTVKKL